MAIYNSLANSNQDDANLTMIDQSFLYGHDDEPTSNSVVKHLQQANQLRSGNNPKNFDDTRDYVYVEHDRLEAAKQIEQILIYYRQELKKESNTQLDCNRQLIRRLVDFIRPAYSSQIKRMNDLDDLFEGISDLQDIRFIDQKEKNEQLNNEILHLKKLIITSANEGDRRDNTLTKVYRINSMVNYEQMMEMEEEVKKLHNLVETQRDRINELVKLISQEDEGPVDKQRPTTFNPNPVTTKGRASTNEQQASGTRKSTNEFHSPGISPIHSLTDFLTESLVDTVDNETQTDETSAIGAHALRLLSRLSSSNDNSVPTRSNQYVCPNCNQHCPGNDEVYLQHLTECFNGLQEHF